MEKELSVKEILDNICGTDENGDAKSLVGVFLHRVDDAGNVLKEISTCNIYKPSVQIFPQDEGFTQIDIIFTSEADGDLNKINRMIYDRLKLNEEILLEDRKNEHIILAFSFLPMEDDQSGYICAVNPFMHCLTALNPKSEVATIRLLFDSAHVQFYQVEEKCFKEAYLEVEEEEKHKKFMQDRFDERKRTEAARLDNLK